MHISKYFRNRCVPLSSFCFVLTNAKGNSWPVVVELLSSNSSVRDEIKIFAAQTLRSKVSCFTTLSNSVLQIKYDFHQLSLESTKQLKDKLLELFVLYANGPRVILIQICVSIAALGLQFKTWNSVISDVVHVCEESRISSDALWQFLAILPEEVYAGRKMILTVLECLNQLLMKSQDQELNDRITVLLTKDADEVFKLLLNYAQSPCTDLSSVENIG